MSTALHVPGRKDEPGFSYDASTGITTARFPLARLLILSLRSTGAGISLIDGTLQLMRCGMSLSPRALMCSAWRVQTPAMLSVASARPKA